MNIASFGVEKLLKTVGVGLVALNVRQSMLLASKISRGGHNESWGVDTASPSLAHPTQHQQVLRWDDYLVLYLIFETND